MPAEQTDHIDRIFKALASKPRRDILTLLATGEAHDTDRCCADRKLGPLRRAIAGSDAWISAIRADQSTHRARADVVGWDAKFGLAKVNPLLAWTKRDVWAFIVANDVPYNPMHDRGFPSVGCWPCTRAVGEGETDDRAGRWAGQAKTECGLHSLDSSQL